MKIEGLELYLNDISNLGVHSFSAPYVVRNTAKRLATKISSNKQSKLTEADKQFIRNVIKEELDLRLKNKPLNKKISSKKIKGKKIINLRPIISKKSQDKAVDILTKISALSQPPKPKVINLRPIIEKKVAAEQTKNLVLMGLPLLFLL